MTMSGGSRSDVLPRDLRGSKVFEFLIRPVQATLADDPKSKSSSRVHDLRVASRRLDESLVMCRSALPERRFHRALRSARRLRKGLGRARMAEVLAKDLLQLAQRDPSKQAVVEATILELRSWAEQQSASESPPLRKLVKRLKACRRSFQPKAKFQKLGREHLRMRAASAQQGWDKVQNGPQALAQFHRLRVHLKRLRYTLELLSPWVAARNTDWLRALRGLQAVLGDLQDADDLVLWLPSDHELMPMAVELREERRHKAWVMLQEELDPMLESLGASPILT